MQARRLRCLVLAAGLLASAGLQAMPPLLKLPPGPPSTEAEPEPPAQAADAGTEAQAQPPEPVVPYERCGVVYEAAKGSIATKVVPSIHLVDLADGDSFKIPDDAPAGVKAVQCGRDSIGPLRNDYKVLLAGFPLSLVARDGRVAVLEASNGKLQLRALEGKLTDAENEQVQVFLDEAQFAFDKAKLAPPAKP